MAQKPLPSADVLRQLLHYDPQSGVLTWRQRSAEHYTSTAKHSAAALAQQFNAKYAGKPALSCVDSAGYKSGRLYNSQTRAHRVIWKIIYGEEPDLIDHINKNKQDNRLCNLRSACRSANMINSESRSGSGVTGVSYDKQRRKWIAQISVKGVHKAKRFWTKSEAIKARQDFEREFWKSVAGKPDHQPSARDQEIEQAEKKR